MLIVEPMCSRIFNSTTAICESYVDINNRQKLIVFISFKNYLLTATKTEMLKILLDVKQQNRPCKESGREEIDVTEKLGEDMFPELNKGWTAGKILKDRSHIVHVPDAVAAYLAQEIQSIGYMINPAEMSAYNLICPSTLKNLVVQVREKLLSGPGLAVLSGPALAHMSDAELEAFHLLVSKGLGRLMWQNSARDLLIRVEDIRPQDTERARGFTSNTRMLLHTDGWDCAGLMCLSEPASGGTSLFASSEAICAMIAAEAPGLIPLLFDLWDWDVRVFTGDPSRGAIQAPIFSIYENQLSCRYGCYMLRNGPQAAGRILDRNRSLFLDVFEAIASQESLVLRHQLKRGDSVWMNNGRVLHGREAFYDSYKSRRRLIRLWAIIDGAPPKAPEFTAFDEVTFGQSLS